MSKYSFASVLLSVVNTTQDFHNTFFMFHASDFKRKEINFVKCGSPTRNLTGYIVNNVKVRTLYDC